MPSSFDGAISAGSKAKGTIWIDGREVAETVMCVHCGRHWVFERGSGRKRGFCTNCMGITCGSKRCSVCFPLQEKLELYEKGILRDLT